MRFKTHKKAVGMCRPSTGTMYCNKCMGLDDRSINLVFGEEPVSSGKVRYIFAYDDLAGSSCRYCGQNPLAPAKRKRKVRLAPFYLNIYKYVQTYGGPEEGGWYYDRRFIMRSTPYPSKRIALRMYMRVNDKYWNLGYAVEIEREPGTTADRQHYE